ncbi:MAG: M18 family aminopeptidase [Lachnospiraceae bacterium]|nr:M18 family aminopeptidase [Lachnospiraceae bacterium]
MNERITKLADYIEKAVSPYHAVAETEKLFINRGFKELKMSDNWGKLDRGQGYYINVFGSAQVAFYVGDDFREGGQLKVVMAHTDSPGLKIKTMPRRENPDGSISLNTEVYGGPILNTWMDRPLSIAGRVMLKGENVFEPVTKLVDAKKSVATIPNLAIHMNREVNKGVELNKQIDLLPLVGGSLCDDNSKKGDKWLFDVLGVNEEDVISHDLYVYDNEKPRFIGIDDSMLSAPRIDNLSSVWAGAEALCEASVDGNMISVFAAWDNEEVGSQTKQGGDSETFAVILEKIYLALGLTREEYLRSILSGVMISADVAHAAHPNRTEKADITNKVFLNKGVAFKISGNQKYATDAETLAIMESLCRDNDIQYQRFLNRSDIPGGSTIGSLMSSHLPLRTLDLGIPMLAMHSARELSGVEDQEAMYKLMKVFFEV